MLGTNTVLQLGCAEWMVLLLFSYKGLALCYVLYHDLKTIETIETTWSSWTEECALASNIIQGSACILLTYPSHELG